MAAPTSRFGDPNVPHEPGTEPAGTGWRPACSCGFRPPLTHDTEDGALRAAQNHAKASAPQPEGQYFIELDAGSIVVRCSLHPAEQLAAFPRGWDGHETDALDAIHAHHREHHGETPDKTET